MVRTEYVDLVGERLTAIVIKSGPRSPTVQLYLVLTGERHYEFYEPIRK